MRHLPVNLTCSMASVRRRTVVVTAFLCILAVQEQATAAPFDRLIVFGDSLSDAGNDLDLLGFPVSPPYFDGRFTNGPVWIDHVAGGLGLPTLEPSRLGGSNYAYGGAQSGDGNSTVTLPLIVPNVGPQIDHFVVSDGTLFETDLITVWIGHNDLNGSIPPSTTATNFQTHIQTLYDLGARNFLVADFAGHPNASTLNNLQRSRVKELQQQNAGMVIAEFSLSSLISEIVNEPLQFGFTNLGDAACSHCGTGVVPIRSGEVVPNPAEYFFWDDIHPSAAAHWHMGERALKEVADRFEFVIGDCNGDGVIDPSDLLCLATLRQRHEVVTQLGTVVGDLDGDGSIAFDDFLVLAANFGLESETSYATGDIDLDGAVQFTDFLVLSKNYGFASRVAEVPEPTALTSFAMAALFLSGVRQLRRAGRTASECLSSLRSTYVPRNRSDRLPTRPPHLD